jgi:hypothetical protein
MGYVHSVLGAHMAKYGTIITPLRLAINILLRLVIVYIAGGSLLIFYFLIWFYDFVRPTIDLFTLLGGVMRLSRLCLLSRINICCSQRFSQSSRDSVLQRPVVR